MKAIPKPKPTPKPAPKVSQDAVPEIVKNDKSQKVRCDCGQEVMLNNLERQKKQKIMKQ